jgi:phage gp45-like
MHRATPLNSSFRAYVAGGARVTVPEVDDTKLMQESKGNFMANEAREKIESPQNYGFTSVVRDAMKNAQGKISESAETFVHFMGGNRSFPVFGNMDDRRFRLKELQKGDVAMFDYLQHQFHLNTDGMFMTGRTDKKLKLQLVDPPQDDQSSSSSSQSVQALDGSTNGGSSQSNGKAKGQKKRYDQSTKQYVEVTKDTTNLVHDQTIQHKTGVHSFQPPESSGASTYDASGNLVQIFGNKFTGGLGYFMKQVTAAPPTSSMHLTTQGYVQSIINGLGFSMPSIPSLPMPPLPPGITLPPGVTLPLEAEPERSPPASGPTWVESLTHRLDAIEARLTRIEEIMEIR